MSKFQPFSFKSLDDFFQFLPKNELYIVEELRGLIIENTVGLKEKLSYNVPFYSGKKRMFFIWPGSVPWGKSNPGKVIFGVCQGKLLDAEVQSLLEFGERKVVGELVYSDVKEIDEAQLKVIIEAAFSFDKIA